MKTPTDAYPLNSPIKNLFSLFVIAFVIGLLTWFISCKSFLGTWTIPLSALVGFIMTITALICFEKNKRIGQVFAIAGAITCLVSISALLLLDFNQSHALVKRLRTNQKADSSFFDVTKTEWATSASVTQGDIGITISDVAIRRIVSGTLSDSYVNSTNLCIGITVYNGSNTNIHRYSSWSKLDLLSTNLSARLVDANGNNYKRIYFPFVYPHHEDETSIYPNQILNDGLIFEMPVKNIRSLFLELPAENFGGTGIVRWTPKTGPQVKIDFRWSASEKKADYESKTQTA